MKPLPPSRLPNGRAMSKIPLEDFCEDIVGKAMRGLAVADAELSEKTGVSCEAIQRLRRGDGEESTARAVAPHLGLDPDKLADSFSHAWTPEPRQLSGLSVSTTEYGDMLVNAFLIWDPDSRLGAMVDTGNDASELLERVSNEGITLVHVFLTHTHRDHIADLARVREAHPHAIVHVGARELFEGALPIEHGDTFRVGGLQVSARHTWGHAEGGMTYVVEGLGKPVAVVGDGVFAGSMGGGMVSYGDALRTNREEILTLSDETILCPGHGPLSTVGEEKAHNPFF